MQKIDLSLPQFTGSELVIREGKSIDPKEPVKIALSGDIKSVASFIGKRIVQNDPASNAGLQKINVARSIVEANKDKGTIKLFLDPESSDGCEILASLDVSDELKVWGINTGNTLKREQLVKMIKFNKLHFDEADKHAMLLDAYQKFNAKAYLEMVQEADTRGNRNVQLKKTTETNIPVDFVLNIPIFKGFGKVKFHVEICLEVTDGGANFWMESVELHELVETQKSEIFDEQLKSCEGFVIINK